MTAPWTECSTCIDRSWSWSYLVFQRNQPVVVRTVSLPHALIAFVVEVVHIDAPTGKRSHRFPRLPCPADVLFVLGRIGPYPPGSAGYNARRGAETSWHRAAPAGGSRVRKDVCEGAGSPARLDRPNYSTSIGAPSYHFQVCGFAHRRNCVRLRRPRDQRALRARPAALLLALRRSAHFQIPSRSPPLPFADKKTRSDAHVWK